MAQSRKNATVAHAKMKPSRSCFHEKTTEIIKDITPLSVAASSHSSATTERESRQEIRRSGTRPRCTLRRDRARGNASVFHAWHGECRDRADIRSTAGSLWAPFQRSSARITAAFYRRRSRHSSLCYRSPRSIGCGLHRGSFRNWMLPHNRSRYGSSATTAWSSERERDYSLHCWRVGDTSAGTAEIQDG
jgi:hypothetical protein